MIGSMTVDELIAEHESKGRYLEVNGIRTFVRDEGEGPAVVLLHGVPVSSWLWRSVIPELSAKGLRAIAPDLPGTGLSGRPEDFDYSWTGLGRHVAATLEALGLDRFHLVVHDIGGPVGYEAAAILGDRVLSLTVLNTIVDPDGFKKPFPMYLYEMRGVGEAFLKASSPMAFRFLMRRRGLAAHSQVPNAEIDVHLRLQRRGDGGRAFLKIMRSFETTPEKAELYADVLGQSRPRQVIWGEDDHALTSAGQGAKAAALTGTQIQLVPARHFLQEDQPQIIAERVARLIATP